MSQILGFHTIVIFNINRWRPLIFHFESMSPAIYETHQIKATLRLRHLAQFKFTLLFFREFLCT